MVRHPSSADVSALLENHGIGAISTQHSKGQGMAVPMDLVMKAWSANEYWSISAQLIPPTEATTTAG
ncbi:hypothetical protein [Mycolicibacterium sarraceniae]|uniref:Uncharacterized protein n=1 Tax=Mycolicibacterium sarraceniae TaxID=1534348 RepID=A0A7I7SNJ5_9MYCO|nr:hypothetical protein [Mycolicibacterium sarraceniae]BBY58338.1 hypothetical protein MSAR_14740 [Mycolicibacterium sarraceniae]